MTNTAGAKVHAMDHILAAVQQTFGEMVADKAVDPENQDLLFLGLLGDITDPPVEPHPHGEVQTLLPDDHH